MITTPRLARIGVLLGLIDAEERRRLAALIELFAGIEPESDLSEALKQVGQELCRVPEEKSA